ncbi:MAG: hypothetical protein CL933_19150 [Deltaproteobacteria bacterium]|nr:hypothetical protein [Deltaproteobacteria bacterium]
MRFVLPISVLLLSMAPSTAVAQEAIGASMWRAEARNNICGLSNPRHVTDPAVVKYKEVLDATPEMKDLDSRGIDPRSAEGQILRQRAVDHVRRVGSKVMRKSGNCSMWKSISHRDGRVIRDLTDEVVAAIGMSPVSMANSSGALASGPASPGPGQVFAAASEREELRSSGSSWTIPLLMGLVLLAGWYGARKRAAAISSADDA